MGDFIKALPAWMLAYWFVAGALGISMSGLIVLALAKYVFGWTPFG